jgi:hypothetical protein
MVACIGSELVPDSGPGLVVDQRRMQARVERTPLRDLPGVDRVCEQAIEMAAREGFAAALRAIRCRAAFCPQPKAVGFFLDPAHAA